jgi:aryl-alcohol dehydrogenase-like predicted oxidoreductase
MCRGFGKTGWSVSAIGQGCWNIGNQWGALSDETADRILRTAYDNGINLFDTAESYADPNGMSELRLGKALKAFPRDKVYVVSKIGHWGKRTGQGAVTGDLATTALRYVISHAAAPVAIPGATRPEQARTNAVAGAETLSAGELRALNEAAE